MACLSTTQSERAACGRALIPMHRDLRLAGQLPPLDAPHHMRADEWRPFREGVVTAAAPGAGSMLDVGVDMARSAFFPCSSSVSEEAAHEHR